MRPRYLSLLPALLLLAACSNSSGHNDTAFGAGQAAEDYLQAEPFDRMVIEVDVAEGVRWDESRTDLLVERVRELCYKPGGVEVVFGRIPAADLTDHYTVKDMRDLRNRYFDHRTGGHTAGLYVLVLNGDYQPEAAVLGFVVDSDTVALFADNIRRQQPDPDRWAGIEEAVLVHEFGHVVGLVGRAHAHNHEAGEHEDHRSPHHDRNPACVMYWLVGRTAGEPATEFCQHCREDATFLGGRGAQGPEVALPTSPE